MLAPCRSFPEFLQPEDGSRISLDPDFHSARAPSTSKSGQRITTEAGSRAELVLNDQTTVTPDPRTSLRIEQTTQGPSIQLEQGRINLEAAKQPAGKFISIEASGTQVKVLGTRLDVRVVQKTSGGRQTVVRVDSGRVEMASAGQSVLLGPGTIGVPDEKQPPVRSSLTFEVNELIALFHQSKALAAQSGREHALPGIVDFTTGTIWSVVLSKTLQPAGPNRFSLRLKYPAFRAKAYTLDGAEIPVEGTGTTLYLNTGSMETPQQPEFFILKVPGIAGLLTERAQGLNEYSLPGSTEELPVLLQLHLPLSAHIANLSPLPRATSTERNRLLVTVLAAVRLPQLYE